MADKIIYHPDQREPVKIYRNFRRTGLIVRQGPSVVFADWEICANLIDALSELIDEVDQ